MATGSSPPGRGSPDGVTAVRTLRAGQPVPLAEETGGRTKRYVIAGALLLVAAWVALVARSTLHARDHGRRAVDLARQLSSTTATIQDPADLRSQVDAVGAELDLVDDALHDPWMMPVGLLPWVGTQLDSVRAMTATAARTLRSGERALQSIAATRDDVNNGLITPAAALASIRGPLAELSEAARGDLGPRSPLLPVLAANHEALAAELAVVADTADRLVTVATGTSWFLDGGRYLILFANPAEARMGGGMFLQAGVLEVASDGSLALSGTRHSLELRTKNRVEVRDAALARYWAGLLPNQLYQNTALTPRFPAVAEQASRMWTADEGGELDGVIAADPTVLQALLRLTGPVRVGDRELSAESVLPYLAVGQYEGADAATDARRDALTEVVTATLVRLQVSRPDPMELFDALRGAVEGRHLKLWSVAEAEQAAWIELGADGDIGSQDLLVAVSNHQPSKLDSFLHVSAAISAVPQGQTVRYVLTMDLTNTATGAEPPYVLGFENPGEYFGILALYLPEAATAITWNGQATSAEDVALSPQFALAARTDDVLVAAGPEGRGQLTARSLALDSGEHRTVTVSFELPADRAVRLVPSGRLPGIAWTTPGVTDAVPVWLRPDGVVSAGP